MLFVWSRFLHLDLLVMFALWFKIGIAPIHFWVLDFIVFSGWYLLFWFTTFQKLGLYILLYGTGVYGLLNALILFSMVVRLLYMWQTYRIKVIMVISSIIHSSWLLLSLQVSSFLFSYYFVVYLLITAVLFRMFYYMDLSGLVLWSLVAISGIPPLSVFMVKVLVLQSQLLTTSIVLVAVSLFRLFIYFLIMYNRYLVQFYHLLKLWGLGLLFYFVDSIFPLFILYYWEWQVYCLIKVVLGGELVAIIFSWFTDFCCQYFVRSSLHYLVGTEDSWLLSASYWAC